MTPGTVTLAAIQVQAVLEIGKRIGRGEARIDYMALFSP